MYENLSDSIIKRILFFLVSLLHAASDQVGTPVDLNKDHQRKKKKFDMRLPTNGMGVSPRDPVKTCQLQPADGGLKRLLARVKQMNGINNGKY